MNILVTGGAGFVDSHTLIELMIAGWPFCRGGGQSFQCQSGIVTAGGEHHRAGDAFL